MMDITSGLGALNTILVNVGGTLSSAEAARVPAMDRGFLYGDSLYEVVRTHGGVFLHLDEHFERLHSSAKLCHLQIDQSASELKSEILRTHAEWAKRHPNTEAYCRLVISRGSGKIGFGQDAVLTKTLYAIYIMPLPSFTAEQFQKGLSLQVSARLRNDPRALDPAMKSGNYLNCVLAFLEARADGFEDAVLCNSDGEVTEGTTFNIFYVKGNQLVTPPLDIGILEGITRREVLRLGREIGMEAVEKRFRKEDLYGADEIFVTGTVKEVFPVTRIDAKTLKGPGPRTQKLAQAYRGLLSSLSASQKKKT